MTTPNRTSGGSSTEPTENPRTLIFSQRNLSKRLPFRCAHFEFEDVISQIDSVDMLAPRMDPTRWGHTIAKQIAYHSPIVLNPGIEWTPIKKQYDLFLAICGDPTDLLRVSTFSNWRPYCKKAVCLIDELWVTQMAPYGNFFRMLEQFDTVILYYSQSVAPLNERIGKKCIFLPPGVDTVRFSPWPNPPERVVDVYSIGRRSAVTHRTLLKIAAEKGLFYLYDSTSADQVIDPTEHRNLFANVLKRSQYFLVNPGLIDRPDIRGDQIEIGNRYFEAAASGTIMLGERPNNGQFEKLFDWPDSVIDVPYNCGDIDKIVNTLNIEPETADRMRRANVQQALLRHDWVYRWEAILNATGIEPLPQLFRRKGLLQNLAADVTHQHLAQA